MPLDADIAARSEEAQQILDHAELTAEKLKRAKLEPVLLQAREVGAALVDEATEREADLLVVGLPYRKRFGGDFAIGRTIPYVLKHAPCEVWVVREPIPSEPVPRCRPRPAAGRRVGEVRHRRLRTRGRGAGRGVRQRRPRGHRSSTPRRGRSTACRASSRARPSAATARTRTSCARPAPSAPTCSSRSPRATTGTSWPRRSRWRSCRSSKAVAKINDPVRAAAYAELGIATVCRTTMLTDAILGFLELRPTGMPSVIAPVPHVHDDEAGRRSRRRSAAPAPGPSRRATRRAERCSCWSSAAGRSATT